MNKIKNSLFLRMFLIFGATFLLLSLAIGLSFRIVSDGAHRAHLHKNTQEYAKYLSKEIGNPPNLDKAKELNRRLGVDILIPSLQPPFETTVGLFQDYEHDCIGKSSHFGCMRYKKVTETGIETIFTHKKIWEQQAEQLPTALPIAVFLILIVLTISYRFVRKIFSPVQDMIEAANAFSEGKWEQRVKVHRQDELGHLAETLNSMAGKIRLHLRSKRELQIAVSHELRSPLARMKVASEFIADEKVRASLNEEITLLDRMTSNLLERDRLEARPEILNKSLSEFDKFIKMICEPFGERVVCHLKKDVQANIDQDRMALCIRNLIDNALKYSENEVHVSLETTDKTVVIEIQDTGIGISHEDLQHVTEPFFRGDASRTGNRKSGGFGFGLSLCKTVIEAHEGQLEIESEPGEGTLVKVRLTKHRSQL